MDSRIYRNKNYTPEGVLLNGWGGIGSANSREAKTPTGGSSDYYKAEVAHPTTAPDAYTAECNDIIEALGLDFAEGNIVKAIWRSAKAREGEGKSGNSASYDAEKVFFFAVRVLVKTWAQNGSIDIDGVRAIDDATAIIWAAKKEAGK